MERTVLEESQSAALTQELLTLEAIDQNIQRRHAERGIDYFTPNPPQLRALRSNSQIIIYCGGNRAGKSTCGATWLTAHLTNTYPKCNCHGDWFSTNRRFNRPLKAVIVVTEFQKIESVIEPKLLSLLPKAWIKNIRRTPQGYLRRLHGVNGSVIDVLSSEQDPMAFEGQDWDLAWIDEPTSHTRFIAIQRGLTDRRGLTMMTFTPLVEPWMKRELVDKADGRNIDVIQADSYANLADIHGSPIQKVESLRFLESLMTEEEKATRIHGQFFHLKGLVYKEFYPSTHLKDFTYAYPDPVLAVLDPHDRKPHHVLWAFLDRKDWLYVDRELVIACTIQELKKAILSTERNANYKMVKRVIDPNFGRSPLITTGRTVIQELAMSPFSVPFGEGNDDKTAGHLKVKEYLHFDRNRPLDLTNSPRLYFHQTRVPATISSIQNYQFDEWRGATKDDRDPKEKEKQKETDGADCVRYLCMANPRCDSLIQQAEQYEMQGAAY